MARQLKIIFQLFAFIFSHTLKLGFLCVYSSASFNTTFMVGSLSCGSLFVVVSTTLFLKYPWAQTCWGPLHWTVNIRYVGAFESNAACMLILQWNELAREVQVLPAFCRSCKAAFFHTRCDGFTPVLEDILRCHNYKGFWPCLETPFDVLHP